MFALVYIGIYSSYLLYTIYLAFTSSTSPQEEYDPNKKEIFFSPFITIKKRGLWKFCVWIFVLLISFFFFQNTHGWGLDFLFSWNKYVTCWYVKKQAVFLKWGAFKIFGSDKLIFKSTRKTYSVICCVLQGNSNTVMF